MLSLIYLKLKSLCARNRENLSEVQKKLGISASALNRWNNGQDPNTEHLIKISKYFDVSMEYLLSDTIEISDLSKVQRNLLKTFRILPSDRQKALCEIFQTELDQEDYELLYLMQQVDLSEEDVEGFMNM